MLCSLCNMLYIQPTYKTIAWLSLLTLQVLRQVEENLKQFNANYMILKDYFCEVEDKLKSLCQQVSQVLLYSKIITIRLVYSVQKTECLGGDLKLVSKKISLQLKESPAVRVHQGELSTFNMIFQSACCFILVQNYTPVSYTHLTLPTICSV